MAELRADAGLRLRTGAMVPSIGCGTMFLRGSLCEKVVSTALSMGYRLVDTASMYGNEREVGDAIRRSGVPREELFVVSKVKPDDMGYDATLAACAKSRAELGLDYLDAYLVHAPGGSRQAPARLNLPLFVAHALTALAVLSPREKRRQTWHAMEELLASGKCRAIGVSNYLQRHLREIENDPDLRTLPHLNQCEFSVRNYPAQPSLPSPATIPRFALLLDGHSCSNPCVAAAFAGWRSRSASSMSCAHSVLNVRSHGWLTLPSVVRARRCFVMADCSLLVDDSGQAPRRLSWDGAGTTVLSPSPRRRVRCECARMQRRAVWTLAPQRLSTPWTSRRLASVAHHHRA